MKIHVIALVLLTLIFGATPGWTAQRPPVKNARIGILGAMSASGFADRLAVFREQLRELGYLEGENVKFEERWADGKLERLDDLAADLVGRKVDVLVTFGGASPAASAKRVTRTVPIVMAAGGSDPAASGLVASLARPGGNITGMANSFMELRGKQMELLKETLPRLTRVAMLWNPESRTGPAQQTVTQYEGELLALKLQSLPVRSGEDFENAFAAAKKERAGALLVTANPLIFTHLGHIAGLAITYRLPAIHPQKEFAEAGGLIMYGPSEAEIYRRAATYVDKILKGAKPSDLPVERPHKFQLIFNLKTAKQIGLTIPPNVLARADRVIR